jgi:SAM-dependent methyltransferase
VPELVSEPADLTRIVGGVVRLGSLQGSASQRGSAYANYLEDESERIAEGRRRYERDLAPLLPAASAMVLEIGCATGSVLRAVRDAGHRVLGIDLSPRFAAAAGELHGIEVRVGDFRDLALPGDIDMVTLFGTISNLTDLADALRAIHAQLRPGGVLVANYPAADSWTARAYGRRLWMFAPSASTILTTDGCRRALERAGFRVAAERADRQMPSLRKVLNHTGASPLLSVVDRLGISNATIPMPLPIPGVRLAVARVA